MPALAKLLAVTLLAAGASTPPAPVTLNGVDIAGVRNQRFENATVVIDDQGAIHIEARGYSVRTVDPAAAAASSAAIAGDAAAATSASPVEGAPGAPAAALAASPPVAPPAGSSAEAPTAPPPGASPPATPAPASTLIPAAPASPAVLVPPSGPARGPTRRYFLVTQQSQPDATQYDVSVFINSQWIREVRSNEENLVMEVTKFLRVGPNQVTLEARKRSNDRHGASPDATLRVIVGEGTAQGNDVTIDDPVVDMRRNAAETESFTEEYSLVAR